MTYTRASGQKITITRRGATADVHVQAPDGRTIATVDMPVADAYRLVADGGE